LVKPLDSVAVAIHDVTPATLDDCVAIRETLDDWRIEHATLLAIPAPGGEPFHHQCAETPAWLRARAASGDAIAQHGFEHARHRRVQGPNSFMAHLRGGHGAEFAGFGDRESEDAVDRGREILAEAGLEPHGFVAPAYAYSPALRRVLGRVFDWWADLSAVRMRGNSRIRSRALGLGSSTAFKRLTSPALVGAAGLHPGPLMRIDIHPADFERRSHRRAIEALLRRARPRRAVSYDELAAGADGNDAAGDSAATSIGQTPGGGRQEADDRRDS
jgi:predicted deacetylase